MAKYKDDILLLWRDESVRTLLGLGASTAPRKQGEDGEDEGNEEHEEEGGGQSNQQGKKTKKKLEDSAGL